MSEIDDIKKKYGIIGNSQLLDEVVRKAIKWAPSNRPVFIQGENGVGKEAIAKIIALENKNFSGEYRAINCSAIPKDLIDSHFFGYAKGAFTGAEKDTEGLFETCNNGTIFLDEVADLSLEAQVKLLRVLSTGEFMRVGETNVRKTNVRIVSATNVDLVQAMSEGRFRSDLYYRLNMSLPAKVPPLRERTEDIPVLFNYFVKDFVKSNPTYSNVRLTAEAMNLLKRQPWQGNVRELQQFACNVVAFESGNMQIDEEILKQYLPEINLPATKQQTQMSFDDLKNITLLLTQKVQVLQEDINKLSEEFRMLKKKLIDVDPALYQLLTSPDSSQTAAQPVRKVGNSTFTHNAAAEPIEISDYEVVELKSERKKKK